MSQPRLTDILDEREPLKRPLLGSVALHGALFGVLSLVALWEARPRERMGDPNALGSGAVGVTAVKQIPLMANQGPKNPIANDTESQVPMPEKPQPKAAAKEDPAAIALKSRNAKRSRPAAIPQTDPRKLPPREQQPNQLTSRTGQAASSPVFGMTPGAGGVGVGTGTPFGTRFGAYALLVRDRVSQKWRTDEVDSRVNTAPPAIVTFEIQRDGSVRNIRVAQSSGILSVDNSARRAITEASPFQPLPGGYEGNSAVIEFWFQLKR